jgi:hypothetical protein
MSSFDPQRDGWSLCEAVRRGANQWALAALHRDLIDAAAAGITHEPIHWWHWADPPPPPPAPPHNPSRPTPFIEHNGQRWLLDYGIETEFLHNLYDGQLSCWGRLGSVQSDYMRVPRGAVTGIESWWKGGGIIRVESGELLYAVRVERLDKARMQTPDNGVISCANSEVTSKPKWQGFDDKAELDQMRALVKNRSVQSLWEAAMQVAPGAKGGGSIESKAKRLHSKYSETENS